MQYKRGDIVMSSYPFVHVLSQNERYKRCDQCFERSEEALKRCSACAVVRYCSIRCQRNSWTLHKKECVCFKRIAPMVPTDSTLLMLRLLLRLEKNDISITPLSKEDPQIRTFNDLMSHTEDIKGDPKRTEQFVKMCVALQQFVGDQLKVPTTELLEIFGKMIINSFSICSGEMQPIGAGVYLSPSILDHSCCPNATTVFDGNKLYVRAVEDIGDISEVRVSYIDQLATTSERKQQLMEQYYFTCNCVMCRDKQRDQKLSSLRCPTTGCDGVVSQNHDGVQHTCLVCGKDTFSEEYLSKCSSSSADAEQILKKIAEAKKEKDFKMVLELSGHCLSEVSDHLHPMHILMIRLHDSAFDACIELQKWDLALVYASKTTEAYREFYAAYHPNLGIHLMKIGKMQQYLKQIEPALKNLQQAEDILHASHGKSHSLCQDLKILLKQCEEELRIQQGRT